MLGLENVLSSSTGGGIYLLLLWLAGGIAVLVAVLGTHAFRDEGMRGMLTIVLRGAAVLVFAALAWALVDLSWSLERAAERRMLETRAAELAGRALVPGSALACLDGVGHQAVEAACAQAVFANPQTVAAAVAYAEARLQLLADGLEYAKRDKNFAAELDTLRRGLEADRFGVVAQALARRGCNAEKCAEFKLFGDASKIRSNLNNHTFAAHVAHYAPRWHPDEPGPAANVAPPNMPLAATSPETPSAGSGGKYNFPSAASIPPISIMSAEPTGSMPSGGGTVVGPSATEAQRARSQSSNRPPTAQRRPPPPQTLGPEN